MRTLLICHHDAPLDREGLVRWLGSFSAFVGTVVIREPPSQLRRRIGREIKRVGWWRFLDVLAFRAYYVLRSARRDREWMNEAMNRLGAAFPNKPDAPELVVSSPNAAVAEQFVRDQRPDLIVARCKTILKPQIFSIPPLGVFVMHPGVCPEYRNAHGCFWALAKGDYHNVGMTLLRIDAGVDTGPVFGYFRAAPDPAGESHVVTEHRVVLDNLDAIRDRLLDIKSGRLQAIDVSGRRSGTWGQPWLSAFMRMRMRNYFVSASGLEPRGRSVLDTREGASASGLEPRGRPVLDTREHYGASASGLGVGPQASMKEAQNGG